jgi:hypothetical protein
MMLLRRRLVLYAGRVRAWFGRRGGIALVLLACAAGAAWWMPRLADQANALRAETDVESARARARARDLPPDSATQMAQFRDWFPQPDRAVEDLRTIFRVAKRQQVQLLRGDYVAGRQPETRLATYDVVLPVRSGYGGIRAFVASVLNELPHASLADLRMERVNGDAVDARVHLTLFYRED